MLDSFHNIWAIFKRRTSGYRWIWHPLAAWAITRFVVMIAAYLSEIAFVETGQGGWHTVPDNLFLDVWAKFDSGFYIRIIEEGYLFKIGEMSNVAFFPVYPLLSNLTASVVGNTVGAGVLVSHLALLGALVFLYRLTELEFDNPDTATRTVFYLAAFPTAFFFSAVYTESTFLFFIVGTMYFARRRAWAWAAIFGMLTAATRIVGVIAFGMVMLEWGKVHGWTISQIYKPQAWRNLWRAFIAEWYVPAVLAVIPFGLFSYMLFLQQNFQDPLAFWTVQEAWGREDLGPIVIIWRDLSGLLSQNFLTGEIWWHVALDIPTFFFALIMGGIIWRKLSESYAIFTILGVLIPASSGSGSMTRYVVVLFPIFMILGLWGRHALVDRFILITSSVLLGVLSGMFANWIFVA